MQQDDIRTTLQALTSKVEDIQKKQSRLKRFMKNCLTKIGEQFNIDFAGCSCSSEEDVHAGVHTEAPGPLSRPEQREPSSNSNFDLSD